MMEASRGHALALFSAEETPEMFFTGKEGLILMVLYLLIVEAVDPNPIFSPGGSYGTMPSGSGELVCCGVDSPRLYQPNCNLHE